MSKKLLEESTIRSFMKLANLQPLTNKFLKESESLEEEELEEEVQEEGETLEEEAELEEGEGLEEATDPEGEKAHKKQDVATKSAGKPKGKSLTPAAKLGVDGAKTVKSPGKFKPLKAGTHHSDKPDSIETKNKSNAPKKNNTVFDKIHESLEEVVMDEEELESPETSEMGGGEDMGSAGESGDHQAKMKELIRGMLTTLKDMGAEYGMSMEISDEGASSETPDMGAVEAPPESPETGGEEDQEEEGMMQEKLDEMVEKLTKRVASRLVKESKKKR